MRALWSDSALVLGSRSTGLTQDGAVTPGQVLCSEMGSAFVIRRRYKVALAALS